MMGKRLLAFIIASAIVVTSISGNSSIIAHAEESDVEILCASQEESEENVEEEQEDSITTEDILANIKKTDISYKRSRWTGYISLGEEVQTPSVISNDNASTNTELPAAFQGYADVAAKYPATRNQNPYGTCWAFASVACGEFDLVKEGSYSQSEADFSELQLAYNMYNAGNDKLGNLDGDKTALASDAHYNYLNMGGNIYFAQHILANWRGLTSESELPYSKAESTLFTSISDSYSYASDKARLLNSRVIDIHEDVASVKRAIYERGAVYGSYYHNSFYYTKSNGKALYNNTSDIGMTNHAAAIVGWDDNFAASNWTKHQPSSDGAWLIRNSWGTGNDESEYCYMWMSYEDTTLADAVYVLDYARSDASYDNIYQHDGSATHAGLASRQVANVFTAQNPDSAASETLEAVMVSMTEDISQQFSVQIYTGLTSDSNPESGTLQSEATTYATTEHAGIYTVKLNEPVSLIPGEKYSIVITTISGTAYYDIETTQTYSGWMSTTASIEAGESFWKSNNSSVWFDMSKFGNGYGNICVKGLTNNCEEAVHEHTYETVTVKATATTDGYVDQKCVECGYSYREFVILKPTIKLGYKKVTYSGSQKQPDIKVTNENGLIDELYYSVQFENNTNVGRAKVTVQLREDWFEPVEAYFTIVPKAPSSASATLSGSYNKVKFSWKASKGASGYTVYYKRSTSSKYTTLGRTTKTYVVESGLSSGKNYNFKVVPYYKDSDGTRYASLQSAKDSVYTLKKVSKPKVTKSSSSKVKVKWTNISGETGYQISRSTRSRGINIVSTYATTRGNYKTLSVKRGVTYYYRVRAYKVVNGKRIYAPWSDAYKLKLR